METRPPTGHDALFAPLWFRLKKSREVRQRYPELASVALDEPAVPAWLDPSRLASVGHKSVRTVHRAGLIDDAAATLMDEILDDWLSPDDDKSGQR